MRGSSPDAASHSVALAIWCCSRAKSARAAFSSRRSIKCGEELDPTQTKALQIACRTALVLPSYPSVVAVSTHAKSA